MSRIQKRLLRFIETHFGTGKTMRSNNIHRSFRETAAESNGIEIVPQLPKTRYRSLILMALQHLLTLLSRRKCCGDQTSLLLDTA